MRTLRRLLPLAVFWAAVIAYYVFVCSAGRWSSWPTWSSLYNGQAEGFRAGHLYLREPANPKLKTLENPWDPANMRYWRWDHTYYDGRLYLYWGLVPALLLAGIKTLLRIQGAITDDMLAFAFAVMRLVGGTLLLRALARRLAQPPPGWAVWLALVVFAVANPVPYALNRGAVYEAAILGGVAFMCLGLFFSQAGIFARDGRTAIPWLAAASASFGLAAGSRISLMPVVAALTVVLALARWRMDPAPSRYPPLRLLLAAGAPAAALMGLHFVLNHLRFGSWSEFGARYQMGWPIKLGTRFFLLDVYGYFFLPPTISCQFPYLSAVWRTTRTLTPAWLSWPADYVSDEPVVGLLVAAPFALFGTVGSLLLAARRIRDRSSAAGPGPAPWPWLWLMLGISTVGSGLLLMFVLGTTIRYELDFSSGLLVVSSLVGWHLLSGPRTKAGRVGAATIYALLAAVTIVAGLLLGFGGYFDHFGRHNPVLLRALQAALSLCGRG